MKPDHSYKSVKEEIQNKYVDKESKFIAHVKPVKNEAEAMDFISTVRAKYWDATHNVYAFRCGEGGAMAQRYSDAGEPQGTAGLPVLDVIRKNDLRDVCIVVTRYFGGTLLGAAGLIRAYGKSASMCIEKCEIVEYILCDMAEIIIDYSLLGGVQAALHNDGYKIISIDYTENVKLTVPVPCYEKSFEAFNIFMIDITNGAAVVVKREREIIALNCL